MVDLLLGAGDIGTALSRRLENPEGVSRSPNKDFHGKLHQFDITEEIPLDLEDYSTVYHLATENSSTNDHGWEIPEVQGTRNIVEELSDISRNSRPELVYLSSCSSQPPGNGLLDYHEAKHIGENIALEYPESHVIRLGNIYGDGKGVVDQFIRQAVKGKELEVYGDGTQKKPFIHIEDAVDALQDISESPEAAYESRYSIERIAEYISDQSGSEIVYRPEKEVFTVETDSEPVETREKLWDYIDRHLEASEERI